MNELAKQIALRIAANGIELLLAEGSVNIYKLVTIVDNAFQDNRQPTDAELQTAAVTLENKIDNVFGPPGTRTQALDAIAKNTAALRGVEPNDHGHEEH